MPSFSRLLATKRCSTAAAEDVRGRGTNWEGSLICWRGCGFGRGCEIDRQSPMLSCVGVGLGHQLGGVAGCWFVFVGVGVLGTQTEPDALACVHVDPYNGPIHWRKDQKREETRLTACPSMHPC